MVESKAQSGALRKAGAVGIFLLSAVVILAAAWAAFVHYSDDLRQDVATDLHALTQLKKSLLTTHIEERQGDAAVFAARRSVHQVLENLDNARERAAGRIQVEKDVKAMIAAYGYTRVLVLDRQLRPVAPNEAVHSLKLPPGPSSDLRPAIEQGKPVLIDLFSTGSDAISYGVARPVMSSKDPNEIIGAVFLEIDVRKSLLPLLSAWFRPTTTGEAFIVRFQAGKAMQVGGNPELVQRLVDERIAPTDPRRIGTRLQNGVTGIMLDAIDRRNARVIAASERIEGTSWFLVSKIDVEEAESSLSDLKGAIAALAGIFLLLAGTLSWMAWRIFRARNDLLAAQYAHALDTAIDGFLRVDEDGRILEANQALSAMSGYSQEQLESMRLDDVEAALDPDQIREALRGMKTGKPIRFVTRWRCRDGRIMDLDVNSLYRPDTDSFYAYLRDISESITTTHRLQQLNLYYNFLVRLNEALAGLRDPLDILGTVCRTAVTHGRFPLVWAGVQDEGSNDIRIVRCEGVASAIAGELSLSTRADHPGGNGPAGRAWREQRVVVINDFFADKGTSERHELARKYGIRAATGIPVVVGGRTMAVISFNASEPDYFNEELQMLMQETSRQVALAWEAGQSARERDAEQALRRQMENRYQRIFDSSPVPKQLHASTDGRLLAINRAHERAFGYALEEIAGPDAWFERAYPDAAIRSQTYAHWMADMQRSRETGTVTHSPELTLRARDGSPRIVRGAMSVTGDVAIVSWTDLTEVRAQEAALRQSEARFLATFEQAAVGIALSSTEGHFQHVNHRLCAILGYEHDELIGKPFQDITHPDDLARDLEAMRQLLAGEETSYTAEKRFFRKDGTTIWINLTVALTRRGDGQPDYFIAVIEDIGKRKQAEVALVESERRFRGMVEQTVSGFYVVQQGRIVYVNQRLCEIAGWSYDELVAHEPFEFVLPEDHERIREGRQQLLAGKAVMDYQLRVRRKDGNVVIMGVHGTMGQWDGQPAIVAIVEDITERTRNAERLADYVKRLEQSMKGTLQAVARMVDLRDPYTAGHQCRVGLISADIGRALGWDKERCLNMELIGLVHDIGKIAVPAELLSKPSRLAPMEYELIKGHAQASYDILKDVKFDVPVADIIVQHHERLDGSGYPRGLKGDEISIEGRVLAVADVLESMASHRPYRPALGIEAALEELQRNRDRLYDGNIVDTVRRMVHEEGYTLPN